MTDADFRFVKMSGAIYEPISAPRAGTMSQVEGLASLRIRNEGSPHGMNLLREAFKKAGMREQERQVTYSIKHSERVNKGGIERAFNYVLFELTCRYGMSPWRPLGIAFMLILFFGFPYIFAFAGSAERKWGIWRAWPEDRVHKKSSENNPQRITFPFIRIFPWVLRAVPWAFYFSLLSAFHIGWRDLNVGNWIARIQPKEFGLRPTGWVRVVSGTQSLISVYLIALWALTYFGRPFE